MAHVLIQAQGGSVPQPDDGGPTDLVGPLHHHLHNLLKGPGAGYVGEGTYLFPVAYIVGFRFVLLRAANQSSIPQNPKTPNLHSSICLVYSEVYIRTFIYSLRILLIL